MSPLFSYFFTACKVGSDVRVSNRFCPHQPSIRALSSVPKLSSIQSLSDVRNLSCRCADAFRDAGAFAFLQDETSQVHTFALTASDGAKAFGFCRHQGPLVACIISKHFWFNVFQEVLQVVEALLLAPLDPTSGKTGPSEWLEPQSAASQFLEALLETALPAPGELFTVRRVITKQPPDAQQPDLLDYNQEIVPDTGNEEEHVFKRGSYKVTPTSTQTNADALSPFDPFIDQPSDRKSASDLSRNQQSLCNAPANLSPFDSPLSVVDKQPASPSSSTSSFSSLQSLEEPDLPFLQDSDSPLRGDESESRAGQCDDAPGISGRLEGWELVYVFERPWDVEGDPLADATLEPLLRLVQPPTLVALLAALLKERRVAIIGPSIGDVSSALFAAAALLHPFQWQHIFLPVLPDAFLHYLSAPMPFLVGVRYDTWQRLQSEEVSLGDVVVLDLGTGILHTSFPDRKELPKDATSSLESELRAVRSADVARHALLRFFLSLFGWYRRFIRFDHVARPDAATCTLWFDQQTFVGSFKDKKTAAFLRSFQGSQMYEAFVREVLLRAAQCRTGEDPFSTEVRRLYDQHA